MYNGHFLGVPRVAVVYRFDCTDDNLSNIYDLIIDKRTVNLFMSLSLFTWLIDTHSFILPRVFFFQIAFLMVFCFWSIYLIRLILKYTRGSNAYKNITMSFWRNDVARRKIMAFDDKWKLDFLGD